MPINKFANAKEMLEYIQDNHDLYSPSIGIHVFLYNDVGSLCIYYLDEEEATSLAKECKSLGLAYWSELLGWGGSIYDDPSYDGFDPDNCPPNLNLCEKLVDTTVWIECDKYLDAIQGQKE